MSKYKKKLSFNFLFIILFCDLLFSQGIFLQNDSDFVISSSANYSKHTDLRDYKYGLSFAMVHKGDLQFKFNYDKTNQYQNLSSLENSIWEEYYSSSITYFIKPNSPIRYAVSTKASFPIKDSLPISSFSFIINGRFLGSRGTGMTYYPYIQYERKFNENYITVIENILKSENDISNFNEIKFGCVITFNDWWIKPFYDKSEESNTIYEGIEIGLWDYNISSD